MLTSLLLLATFGSPVTHTELLSNGLVAQVHQDCSVTFTTVETVAPELAVLCGQPIYEPGEVVFEWKNTDGITCRARVDCVTLKYEDCVARAIKLRDLMLKSDPVPVKRE